MVRGTGRKSGLLFIPLLSILLLASLSAGVYIALNKKWMDSLIQSVETQRRQNLIQILTIARNTVEPVLVRLRLGEIDVREATERIRPMIRNMTYVDQYGSNYVVMSRYDGITLALPFETAKEMTNEWDLRDANGVYIVRELVKAAQTNPFGSFVKYLYYLPGVYEVQEKTSFVIGLPEIDSFLATGMYMQKPTMEQRRILETFRISSLWLLAAVFVPAVASILIILYRNGLLLAEIGIRKEAEDKYRSIFENSAEGIFQASREGRFLSVNPALARMTGYGSCRQMIDDVKDIADRYWDPGDRKPYLQAIRTAGSVRDYLVKLRRRDGTAIWASVNAHAVKDAAGNELYSEGTIQDVTERRRAEEALRENEERLRAITQKMPGVVFQFHVGADGIITVRYASERMAELFGLQSPLKELFPAFAAHVHEEDRDGFLASVRGAVEGFSTWDYEGRFVKPSGDRIWFHALSIPVHHPDGIVFNGILLDVTESRLATEASRYNEDRFAKVFQSVPEFIAITRLSDGRIIEVNKGYEDIIGWKREESVGRTSVEMGIWADPEDRRLMVEDLAADRDIIDREFRFLRRDGARRIGVYSARPIQVDGEACLIFVMQDVTERRTEEGEKAKLQEQLQQSQKMESVGRLAGGVAHDFNNMLGVILGHAELALEQVDASSAFRGSLEEILKAARRSADLTRQLLTFARRQAVKPRVLDLNGTIHGMSKMLRRLIGEDIDLTWQPGKDLWPVRIDPAQLDQVLANLCVNSRDAISGIGRIALETRNITVDGKSSSDPAGIAAGDYVLLSVSDDGSGMTKEVLGHLFEPFFTTKGVGKGTGLGLATTYGIVKQNAGFIKAQSEPGHGTTFRIYLPRITGEAEPAMAPETGTIWRGAGETILLVEDEQAILAMVKAMLRRMGCTVIAVTTPAEAIRQVTAHPGGIRLLITDVIMPEMNGRELADRIGAIAPGLRCLFMSGYTADVIAHQGILEEGVRFIQKPFSYRDLADKVKEALKPATA